LRSDSRRSNMLLRNPAGRSCKMMVQVGARVLGGEKLERHSLPSRLLKKAISQPAPSLPSASLRTCLSLPEGEKTKERSPIPRRRLGTWLSCRVLRASISHLRARRLFQHPASVRFVTAAARAALGAAIIAYRILISPLLVALFGPACRFEPSCSAYAHQALREYGVWRGGYMAASRIIRCHPLGGSGYDPVSSHARSSRGGGKIEGVLWKPGF
jgi:uncharacterized protein